MCWHTESMHKLLWLKRTINTKCYLLNTDSSRKVKVTDCDLQNHAWSFTCKADFESWVVCTGSEWPYVILSTVRSCSMTATDINRTSKTWLGKRLGFITDENLVNVAITRAQDGLCILGKDWNLLTNVLFLLCIFIFIHFFSVR